MSLESEVAALVGASNKLTASVDGKMKEIDKKVDEATASVPAVVRALSEQTFYVDRISGNDDNDGSESHPLKTVFRAINSSAPNSLLTIRLVQSGEHICEVPQETSHHNSAHNKTIQIEGNSSAYDSGSPSTLVFSATPWARDSNRARCNFFEGSTTRVSFNKLNIKLVNQTGVAFYDSSFGGVFTRGSVAGGSAADIFIGLSNCEIEAHGDIAFVTAYHGRLTVVARYTQIVGVDKTGYFVGGDLLKSILTSGIAISGFEDNTPAALFRYSIDSTAKALIS